MSSGPTVQARAGRAASQRDLPRRRPPGRAASPRTQLAVALLAGVLAALVAAVTPAEPFAPLAGWDALVVTYLLFVWRKVRDADAERTAELAVVENPDRLSADALLLGAAVVSLVAVAFVLSTAKRAGPHGAALHAVVAVVSVALSWLLVHVVHTLAYARLYYTNGDGGIGFNTTEAPAYTDFAYVAFTIGMTFQVSDTALESTAVRRVALRHALLSFLFGAVVLATTINLVVGLSG